MKKSLLTLAFLLCSCLTAFSQATSLTVDCQYPGHLSSEITYSNQISLVNLKVTGKLNGTDFNFLKNLQQDHNLRFLDLSDADIVSGGDALYVATNSGTNPQTKRYVNFEKDSVLYGDMFLQFTNLQRLVTPKSCKELEGSITIAIDSLELNGAFEPAFFCLRSSNKRYVDCPKDCKVAYLKIGEGIKRFGTNRNSANTVDSWDNLKELILPNSINEIKNLKIGAGCNIKSAIEHPENIVFTTCTLNGDTIFVPQGTKNCYINSDFNTMKVIVEMNTPSSINFSLDNVKLYTNETIKLSTSTDPAEVFYKELIWETSDETIAIVSQSGEVTGVHAGTAVITVRSAKAPEVNTSCTITVYEHTTGLFISHSEKTLVIGESFSLNAHTIPEGETDNEFTWNSSDESIATIDENGNVTGIQAGTCVITATSVDGGHTATCVVTVTQPVAVTGIVLNSSSLQFDYIGETANLEATVLPENAANKKVNWTSSNPSVCIVSNGMVVSVGMGTSVVIATTEDGGFMAVCVVTVTSATGISSVEQNDGMMFQIYDINGMKQKQLQKGINIIQFKDGSRRKVLIK